MRPSLDVRAEARAGSASLRALLREIERAARGRTFALMEVCGTHTVAIFRTGLRSLLPENIRLVSGPGCPVCVTPLSYLDRLIALARLPDVAVATFGDLINVPGTRSSLARERSRGADIRIVYSPLESVGMAEREKGKRVVLAAVGFETTIPAQAACVLEAKARGLRNYFLLPGGRMIPPAMEKLLRSGSRIDGFICPGHVSVITGMEPYERIARRYGIPCAVAGFEAKEILLAVLALARMIRAGKPEALNLYPRAVRAAGNPLARALTEKVFRAGDAEWRGLGTIRRSGFIPRKEFRRFDARTAIPLRLPPGREDPRCRCGEVLSGKVVPPACPAFARACSPGRPLGPCMVSSEGTCAAWFGLPRGVPPRSRKPGAAA